MATYYVSVEGYLSIEDGGVRERLTDRLIACTFTLATARQALELAEGKRIIVSGIAQYFMDDYTRELEHVAVDNIYIFTDEANMPSLEQVQAAIRKIS